MYVTVESASELSAGHKYFEHGCWRRFNCLYPFGVELSKDAAFGRTCFERSNFFARDAVERTIWDVLIWLGNLERGQTLS